MPLMPLNHFMHTSKVSGKANRVLGLISRFSKSEILIKI